MPRAVGFLGPLLLCAALSSALVPRLPASLPPHPRLMLTDARVSELVSLVQHDAAAAALLSAVEAHGRQCMRSPAAYGVGGLADSATTLGLLHRMACASAGTPPPAPCATPWGDALIGALLAASNASDICSGCGGFPGNCSAMSSTTQRLATLCYSSLGQALAVGYDWLYFAMTQPQRDAVAAMITNQLLDVYAEGLQAAFASGYWFEAQDNFNAAINGAALISALAVADVAGADAPLNHTAAFAADAYSLSLLALQRALALALDPVDGSGYIQAESPTYYTFGLSNLLPAVDALVTATGSDQGLAVPPGPGARFLLDHVGPSGLFHNWGDTTACSGVAAGCDLLALQDHWALMTFARQALAAGASGAPAYAFVARQWAAAIPANGSWYTPNHPSYLGTRMLMDWQTAGDAADLAALPLGMAHDGARIAFLRSSWSAPGASWLGIKGGDNHLIQLGKATTHTHADAGSFVAELRGVRWAADLGSDAYSLPGYFALSKWRASVRTSTLGHNTLTFADAGQDECSVVPLDAADACVAPLAGFALTSRSAGDGWAAVDLGAVYTTSGVAAAMRGIALRTAAGGNVSADVILLRDEFALRAAAAARNVTWRLHTFANVTITGAASATLSATLPSGAQLAVGLAGDATSCPGLRIAASPLATAAPPHESNAGITVVSLSAPDARACAGLQALLGVPPGGDGRALFAEVAPLAQWPASGPWLRGRS